MKTKLVLRPGEKGTRAIEEQYGDRVVSVRYRYDEARHRRIKTVEIIVEEVEWKAQGARARIHKGLPCAPILTPASASTPTSTEPPASASPPASAPPPGQQPSNSTLPAAHAGNKPRLAGNTSPRGREQEKPAGENERPALAARIRVQFDELELRSRIKQAGGRWLPEQKRWELGIEQIKSLGLTDRIEQDTTDWWERRQKMEAARAGAHPQDSEERAKKGQGT